MEYAFTTEPIVAWRVWTVGSYKRHGGVVEPRLSSLGVDIAAWPLRSREAICRAGLHDAPWPSCQCGFWGLRSQEVAEARRLDSLQFAVFTRFHHHTWYLQHPSLSLPELPEIPLFVVGTVALWGRVLECEHGWRAQYAYPRSLTVYGDEETAEALGAAYGVPVEARPAPEPPPLPSLEPNPLALAPPRNLEVEFIEPKKSPFWGGFRSGLRHALILAAIAVEWTVAATEGPPYRWIGLGFGIALVFAYGLMLGLRR